MAKWLWDRLARTKQRCYALRNRIYPENVWPGEIYVQDIRDHGGGALLEVGCGWRADTLKRVADRFERCVGVDPDLQNAKHEDPRIELIAGDAANLPFPDATFDVVANTNTAEHLPDPVAVFRECARVLKPGGVMIIQTVNQWMPVIAAARILPHSVRQILNRAASGTAERDTFPTYYRANSRRNLARAMQAAGFEVVDLRYLPHHPHYFMFSYIVYRVAVSVEQFMRRNNLMPWTWALLHGIFRKPVTAAPEGAGAHHEVATSGAGRP
jgi:ubiquinone/menaquinone biosynthesis C-methylase UbiE